MQNADIYSKIAKLANQLCKDNSTFTRADLAYELKQFGIKCDSEELSKLVWEAYIYDNRNERIKKAFTNNACNKSLVEIYEISNLIDENKKNQALSITSQELSEADASLTELQENIANAIGNVAVQATVSLSNTIQGTSGIQKAKKEAEIVYGNYTKLVDSYEAARCSIQEAATSFVEIRTDIEMLFQKYSMTLTDIFGDSIKAISPQLFDFDTIQWLDIQSMLNQIDLEYTTICSKCSNLLTQISDNFQTALQASVNSYKVLNNKQVGLIVAGLNFLGHYASSASLTNDIKGEILQLKNNIRRDATNIKGDMMRLTTIYKTINDIFIPQSHAFYKYSNNIFSSELQLLIDDIYTTDQSKILLKQRENLLETLKEVERSINDELANIVYYEDNIKECKELLKSLEEPYSKAIYSKPTKPFFLFNILTLGYAKKQYNRKMYEWHTKCGTLVKQYEQSKVDIELDKKELINQQALLKDHKSEYTKLRKEMDAVAKQMMNEIKADSKTKAQMINHLSDLVALLRIGKKIIESKLNDKDINIINIEPYTSLQISPEIAQNIDQFKNTMIQIQPEINKFIGKKITDKINHIQHKQNDDTDNHTTELIQQSIPFQEAVQLFESWTKLNQLKQDDKYSRTHYDKQLRDVENDFKNTIKNIDHKADLIQHIIENICSISNPEIIKQGLMSLADISESEWNSNDWDEFLSGNKQIII